MKVVAHGTAASSAPGELPPAAPTGTLEDFHQWARSWCKSAVAQDSPAAKALLHVVDRLLAIKDLEAARAAADGFMLWPLHLEVVRTHADRHRTSVKNKAVSARQTGLPKALSSAVFRSLIAAGIASAEKVKKHLEENEQIAMVHRGKTLTVTVDVDGDRVVFNADGWKASTFYLSNLGPTLSRLKNKSK